jgi:putative cardiolipin synthase
MASVFLAAWLVGCASLPPNNGRTPSIAFTDTSDTLLGKAASSAVAAHPGMNGIYSLPRGRDAFALRMVLIANAQRSIDLQYFIWRGDTTGLLMFDELWKAADRGVRIRLLLDDQVTRGLDDTLAALDAHPNIEVRLFNPYASRRGFRAGETLGSFKRINRRMHNKSFTVDNQVTVIGGRNIGNEYFGADESLDFSDLDVAAMGPIVHDVSNQFDLYWNDEAAYPVDRIVGKPDDLILATERAKWRNEWAKPEAQRYIEAVRNMPMVDQLRERRLPLEWATAKLVYDEPEKIRQPIEKKETHMLPRLEAAMGKPMRELDLISPYFIPGDDGMEGLGELRQRGVTVRVLTNSLAATDTAPVHAAYKRYRRELLRMNVVLYELKPSAETTENKANRDEDEKHGFGSSGASLHAKTFAIDRNRVFVGSFNVDPRSAYLNTEMGALIDSATLSQRLSSAFDTWIPNDAYQVRLANDGHDLEWIERDNGLAVRSYTKEPNTSVWRRMWINFMSILPLEGLL